MPPPAVGHYTTITQYGSHNPSATRPGGETAQPVNLFAGAASASKMSELSDAPVAQSQSGYEKMYFSNPKLGFQYWHDCRTNLTEDAQFFTAIVQFDKTQLEQSKYEFDIRTKKWFVEIDKKKYWVPHIISQHFCAANPATIQMKVNEKSGPELTCTLTVANSGKIDLTLTKEHNFHWCWDMQSTVPPRRVVYGTEVKEKDEEFNEDDTAAILLGGVKYVDSCGEL